MQERKKPLTKGYQVTKYSTECKAENWYLAIAYLRNPN